MGYKKVLFLLLCAATLIQVYAQNTNNPPKVESTREDFIDSIDETAQGETFTPIELGTMRCSDVDGDTITYRSNVDAGITVDATTGRVMLSKSLDYEKTGQRYTIVLYCSDGNLETEFTIFIGIRDVNDNPPYTSYDDVAPKYFVPENTSVNTVVASLLAFDDDTDVNRNNYIYPRCENLTDTATQDHLTACEYFGVFATKLPTRNNSIAPSNYSISIFLKKPLDYEEEVTTNNVFPFELALENIQNNVVTQYNVRTIFFEVTDIQDQPPFFQRTSNNKLNFYVYEHSSVLEPGDILAQDGDIGDPRILNFTLINPCYETSSQCTDYIALDGPPILVGAETTQRLAVSNEIDREELLPESTIELTVFTVEVSDGDENIADISARINMTVTVYDINDNPPSFKSSESAAVQTNFIVSKPEVPADNNDTSYILSGLNLIVTDPDDNVIYVANDIPNNIFNITVLNPDFVPSETSGSGSVSLSISCRNRAKLDYEVPEYRTQTFMIVASDFEAPSLVTTATVTLIVTDINDNAPDFTIPKGTTYRAFVDEGPLPVNKLVTVSPSIQATDADDYDNGNGRITYSLQGSGSNSFSIDGDSGAITLIKALDYELTQTYVLSVIATDNGQGSVKTARRSLNITVGDINDNAPRFQPANYSSTINESVAALVQAVKVQAADRESGPLGIRYAIEGGNPTKNGIPAFGINSITGDFTALRIVSYDEAVNGSFRVLVSATDNGIPPLKSHTYVVVNVTDENNHFPEFEKNIYSMFLNETHPKGVDILTVKATDKDAGTNGQITYSISGSNENFEIDEDLGVVSVSIRSHLDFDVQKNYFMTVTARDLGNPSKSGTAKVNITLLDMNNKNPSFPPNTYYFGNVDEGEDPGTVVLASGIQGSQNVPLQINATDPDETSALRYSIIEPTVIAYKNDIQVPVDSTFSPATSFEIDEISGIISTRVRLSYNVVSRFNMDVMARDINAYQGIQTATAKVIIYVGGEKDLTIRFLTSREFYLQEGDYNNDKLTALTARDPLAGEYTSIFEEIPGSDPEGYFTVEDTFLKVAKPVDYEALPQNDKTLTVGVRAYSTDRTRFTDANITLRVTDANDNKPVFSENEYNVTLSEKEVYPYTVLRVSATDRDSSSFGAVDFYLENADQEDFVVINDIDRNTAKIIVKQGVVLDYEDKRQYSLQLVAFDNPTATSINDRETTSKVVTITLTNDNDNPPVFTYDRYTITTVSSTDKGINIGTLRATDADEINDEQIYYQFDNDDPDTRKGLSFFSIREDFGQIYTIQKLEGAVGFSPYHMTVIARDSREGKVNTGTALVTITVTSGVQDQRPKFDSNVPKLVRIDEHSPNGTSVANVTAYSFNGTGVLYSFLKTEAVKRDYDKFQIDPFTGHITVAGVLDREIQENYTLIIVATDRLTPRYNNSQLMVVSLNDIDDQRASFDACRDQKYHNPEYVYVEEEQEPPVHVFQAKACDLDSDTRYNQVYYEWYTDAEYCQDISDYFRLQTTSGVITSKVKFNREERPEYVVCVRALAREPTGRRKRQVDIDAIEKRTNTAEVLVLAVVITDINDNGPRFDEDEILAVLPEWPRETEKTKLLTVVAHDSDASPFNRIRYSITSVRYYHPGSDRASDADSLFEINDATGVIRAAGQQYTPGSYFNLHIRAEDYYLGSTLFDTQLVKIVVFARSELIRVVFNKVATQEVEEQINQMIEELNDVEMGVSYHVWKISYHTTSSSAAPVFDRTDVCLVVVRNLQVQDAVSATKRFTDYDNIKQITSKYGATEPGPCEPDTTEYPQGWQAYWWVLVAFAIFIFIVTLILIFLVIALYNNYKSYMDTRRTYLVPQDQL